MFETSSLNRCEHAIEVVVAELPTGPNRSLQRHLNQRAILAGHRPEPNKCSVVLTDGHRTWALRQRGEQLIQSRQVRREAEGQGEIRLRNVRVGGVDVDVSKCHRPAPGARATVGLVERRLVRVEPDELTGGGQNLVEFLEPEPGRAPQVDDAGGTEPRQPLAKRSTLRQLRPVMRFEPRAAGQRATADVALVHHR